MPLPTPKLDDRTFQDIVDEVRSRIPRYCPEWTSHNLSDPGITLIELFAWMTELILYRLNRVPDKNYIKFLEMMGVKLLPPRAAQVKLTFRLSAPQTSAVTIPEGTEVATVRTETEEAIVFTTDDDLVIDVPSLMECLATSDGKSYAGRMPALELPEGEFLAFDPKPKPDNALLLGFGGDLAKSTLVLEVDCEIEGIGVAPDDPPLVWEAWCGARGWCPVSIIQDTTGGLNRHGVVEMIMPADVTGTEFAEKYAYAWLRCRLIKPRPDQPFYEHSPRIKGVVPRTDGGTVSATHAQVIRDEILGTSDGKPGQSFQLRNAPLLARKPRETLMVISTNGEEKEAWQEVEDFADSGPEDKHYVCESATGSITFGPAIRQPDGSLKQHGAIVPKGARIGFSSYRSGGGVVGNVAAGKLTVLKSSIAYVAAVTNRTPARGGADLESMERAKMRAPKSLRARQRAVTTEDFEFFALEATAAVSRAKCLGTVGTPDNVTVCVVPCVDISREHLTRQDFTMPPEAREEIEDFLNQRCLLTVHASVQDAEYIWVTVEARVQARLGSDLKEVKEDVEKRLHKFLDPFTGGPRGDGWPFGRDVSSFELFSLIQEVWGVEAVAKIRLLTGSDLEEKLVEAGQKVVVPRGGLVCSGHHRVEIIEST